MFHMGLVRGKRLATPVRSSNSFILQNHRRKLLPRTWRLTLAEVSNTNVLCTWYTELVRSPV